MAAINLWSLFGSPASGGTLTLVTGPAGHSSAPYPTDTPNGNVFCTSCNPATAISWNPDCRLEGVYTFRYAVTAAGCSNSVDSTYTITHKPSTQILQAIYARTCGTTVDLASAVFKAQGRQTDNCRYCIPTILQKPLLYNMSNISGNLMLAPGGVAATWGSALFGAGAGTANPFSSNFTAFALSQAGWYTTTTFNPANGCFDTETFTWTRLDYCPGGGTSPASTCISTFPSSKTVAELMGLASGANPTGLVTPQLSPAGSVNITNTATPTYSWTIVSGPSNVSLASASTATPSLNFTAGFPGGTIQLSNTMTVTVTDPTPSSPAYNCSQAGLAPFVHQSVGIYNIATYIATSTLYTAKLVAYQAGSPDFSGAFDNTVSLYTKNNDPSLYVRYSVGRWNNVLSTVTNVNNNFELPINPWFRISHDLAVSNGDVINSITLQEYNSGTYTPITLSMGNIVVAVSGGVVTNRATIDATLQNAITNAGYTSTQWAGIAIPCNTNAIISQGVGSGTDSTLIFSFRIKHNPTGDYIGLTRSTSSWATIGGITNNFTNDTVDIACASFSVIALSDHNFASLCGGSGIGIKTVNVSGSYALPPSAVDLNACDLHNIEIVNFTPTVSTTNTTGRTLTETCTSC